MRFNTMTLATFLGLLGALGCGGESTNETAASATEATPEAQAAPSEPVEVARPPRERLHGTWKLSLEGTLPHWPESQRRDMMMMWLVFRPAPPTAEELDELEFGFQQKVGIFAMRKRQMDGEEDAAIERGRAGLEVLMGITLEHDAEAITLTTPDGTQRDTYTVVSEEGDTLVLDTTDDEGETDRLRIVFDDDDRITVHEIQDEGAEDEEESKGPSVMVFVREGSDAAEAERLDPQPETAPESVDVPSALICRWGPEGRDHSVEFKPDHGYILHGANGRMEGEYRVVSAEGDSITVRTRMNILPWAMSDEIKIKINGDRLEWHNTANDDSTEYVRRSQSD